MCATLAVLIGSERENRRLKAKCRVDECELCTGLGVHALVLGWELRAGDLRICVAAALVLCESGVNWVCCVLVRAASCTSEYLWCVRVCVSRERECVCVYVCVRVVCTCLCVYCVCL